jgi:hypothetical protein
MAELTPLNNYGVPNEGDEPYATTMEGYFLSVDNSVWDVAENDNLMWNGGGFFSWNATTGVLIWTAPITITAQTTPYKVIIPGPPFPGGQVTLQDGQVAFFQMPRLLVADYVVPQIQIGTITQIPGVRLENIKILARRDGSTLLMAEGNSLADGDTGTVFGGGLGITVPPHQHQPMLVIEPPFAGVTTLDMNNASFAPSLLNAVQIYRNGVLQAQPADYTINLTSGIVTLVVPTFAPNLVNPNPERFVALRETTPTGGGGGSGHDHLTALVREPIAGTTVLDCLVTSGDNPALVQVDLFRDGAYQSNPADYTIDLTTGLITLVIPSVLNERFVILREVQP